MRNFTKEDDNNLRRILKLLFGSDWVRIGWFKRKKKTVMYFEYRVMRNVDKIEKVAVRLIIAYIERYMIKEQISNRYIKHEFKVDWYLAYREDYPRDYPQHRTMRIIHELV